MDPQNAEYWLAVAAQWIQSKSQTPMMSFPNYPFSQLPQTQVPHPPRISMNDATVNDNLVEADMDIEDVKEEVEEPTQIWSNWQSNKTQQNIQQLPPVNKSPVDFYKQLSNEHQSNKITRFVTIPSAPIIGDLSGGDHSQSVDMMLDSDDQDEDNNSAIIEAQKRKKLPVWIREGLERIEREKKQEEMRIQREQELLKDEESRKKLMEEALKELESEKMSKRKYDSESEDEDEDEEQLNNNSETETNLPVNHEETFEKMMLLVRKTLTEILLEVTDEKIQEISKETLSKYTRKKASSVTSNRTVTNSLGLGVYGNSSDEESDVEESERADDQSDWEPENALKERIKVKSIAFEQKARDIKERLAKLAEAEQERFSRKELDSQEHSKLKTKHESDSEKPSKIRKNVGEEKYEQIYSISQSFASSGRQRDKKKTRFNDPKERTSSILMTHVSMLDTAKATHADNGSPVIPATPSFTSIDSVSNKKRDSSTSSSSSSSGRHKKHKKHKKSSKRSKKTSKKRDRSRSREYDKDRRKSYKSDRRSMESKSSVRSSDSKRHRSRSRSRSRDRHRHDDRHRSRRY